MSKSLIIVESPTKIKTLRKFLRGSYVFESSLGHVRDLPEKKFGIDLDGDMDPEYDILPGKKEVIARLKKAAKECDTVYLAPDPDREGEAIAWHISQILPKSTKIKRVTFNEITKQAVVGALENPRKIDEALVNAQQARRMLDRIVGYKISPLLSRRLSRARGSFLSAGRVQSVALKLVVDREKAIEAFVPQEYWNLGAWLNKASSNSFSSHLLSVDGLKVEKEQKGSKKVFMIPDQKTAEAIRKKLDVASYTVQSVDKKEKRRYPTAPFITSTLQQEASRHFGFSAQRTMGIAQSLYEGVDLGDHGAEGLITYMRTDSTRVSVEAQKEARRLITSKYGKDLLPNSSPQYQSKKAAQDAHEAIRPTQIYHEPEAIRSHLNDDQYKLYSLIWKRFIASQMAPAVYDTVTCDIATNNNLIVRANGSTIKFQGFLAVYQEKIDGDEEDTKENRLPELEVGETLSRESTICEQSFTKPPGRFTEASLVKELEKLGIGRPSTYATIMNKIQSRDYTVKEKKTLIPTELGRLIAQMLEANFPPIMDVTFIAEMEDQLDQIAEDDKDWKKYLKKFWKDFSPLIDTAEKEMVVPKVDTKEKCPKCGHHLQKIWSKGKYFYGCSNYPDCEYTAPIAVHHLDKSEYQDDFKWDQPCPKCGSDMTIRSGRFGIFLGCSKYPDCTGIVNVPKKGEMRPEDLPDCPAKGCPGKLVQRRSRYGKAFFACSTYPDCDVIGNDIESVQEKYKDHERTAAPKRTAKKGKGKGKGKFTQPEKKLSKELQAIVGKKESTRPEITKKLWEYIKKNDLQDPKNKRLIVPDAKLAKVFGSKDPIDMMKLAGAITPHLS